MGLSSATFTWTAEPQLTYRLHYKSLSSDDVYSLTEVQYGNLRIGNNVLSVGAVDCVNHDILAH